MTTTESKIVGLQIDNILFNFDKASLRTDYVDEVDALGAFLQKNPSAYVLLKTQLLTGKEPKRALVPN